MLNERVVFQRLKRKSNSPAPDEAPSDDPRRTPSGVEIRELKGHGEPMVMPASTGDRLSNQESALEGALGSREGAAPGNARDSLSLAKRLTSKVGPSTVHRRALTRSRGLRELGSPWTPWGWSSPACQLPPRRPLHRRQCHGVPLATAGVKVPRRGGGSSTAWVTEARAPFLCFGSASKRRVGFISLTIERLYLCVRVCAPQVLGSDSAWVCAIFSWF